MSSVQPMLELLTPDSTSAPPPASPVFDHNSLRALRPAGGFQLILADPNWRMQMYSTKGEGKAPQAHYDCAGVEDIAALPVGEVAARDAVLVLWAINPMLPQALAVMAAWGFTFKTSGAWLKRTTTGKHWQFGTGYILRGAHEPFLIGTRGEGVSPKSKSIRTILDAPLDHDDDPALIAPVRQHSRKPEQMIGLCHGLWGSESAGLRRLELFACTSRPGWVRWGDAHAEYDGGGG